MLLYAVGEVRATPGWVGDRVVGEAGRYTQNGVAAVRCYALALSDERRAALRERIRAELPVAPDGSTPLEARASAVRGQRR